MKCEEFWEVLQQKNFTFFTGVPDSTFKGWMSFLADYNNQGLTNIIATNEGEAVAIAAGYHLATNKIGIVYMQNSGLGNTINPLTSLIDPEVYAIPVLMLIGWRGEPTVHDEPQHKKMGRITLTLLQTLEIPYAILSPTPEEAVSQIQVAIDYMTKNHAPYAFIMRNTTLDSYTQQQIPKFTSDLTRETAIVRIVQHLSSNDAIISTTGKTSRELFETRIHRSEKPCDFYTVGSMGYASAIGLGISLLHKGKIIILDGDGAMLMHLGNLTTIGHYLPSRYYHICIDNQSHESTGGQPTVSETVKFPQIAQSVGYRAIYRAETQTELEQILPTFFQADSPALLVIHVKPGSRANLGRPTTTPQENKLAFQQHLQK